MLGLKFLRLGAGWGPFIAIVLRSTLTQKGYTYKGSIYGLSRSVYFYSISVKKNKRKQNKL